MGYRLEIFDPKYIASGGKLFGYNYKDKNIKDLASYQWLIQHKHISEDDEFRFAYGIRCPLRLYRSEFEEFLSLYVVDYLKYGCGNADTALGVIREVLLNKELSSVLIDWE